MPVSPMKKKPFAKADGSQPAKASAKSPQDALKTASRPSTVAAGKKAAKVSNYKKPGGGISTSASKALGNKGLEKSWTKAEKKAGKK